jgi:signal transduction histidine kinase
MPGFAERALPLLEKQTTIPITTEKRCPMSRRKWASVITGPTFGITDLGWGDIALALILSAFAVIIVTHGRSNGHVYDAGWAGAFAVLLMTLPVAFARKRPLVVAAVLLAGALVNWWAIGSYVRCGATLPAVFYMAFVVGSRCQGRDRVVGEALVIASILVQCESDPQISPISNAILFIPISLAFLGAGYLLHRRNVTVETLRLRTRELQEQRERNANLAVEADRARIADDLDLYLHGQVHEIAAAAASGRESLDAEPGQAAEAFVAIQGTGRETLTHMREVVGSLRPNPFWHSSTGSSASPTRSTSASGSVEIPASSPRGSSWRVTGSWNTSSVRWRRTPPPPPAWRSCSAPTPSSSRCWGRACARASPVRRWRPLPSGPNSAEARFAPPCTTGCGRPGSGSR